MISPNSSPKHTQGYTHTHRNTLAQVTEIPSLVILRLCFKVKNYQHISHLFYPNELLFCVTEGQTYIGIMIFNSLFHKDKSVCQTEKI